MYCICLPTLDLFCVMTWNGLNKGGKKGKNQLAQLSWELVNEQKYQNRSSFGMREGRGTAAQGNRSSALCGIWARCGRTDGSGEGSQKKGQKLQF